MVPQFAFIEQYVPFVHSAAVSDCYVVRPGPSKVTARRKDPMGMQELATVDLRLDSSNGSGGPNEADIFCKDVSGRPLLTLAFSDGLSPLRSDLDSLREQLLTLLPEVSEYTPVFPSAFRHKCSGFALNTLSLLSLAAQAACFNVPRSSHLWIFIPFVGEIHFRSATGLSRCLPGQALLAVPSAVRTVSHSEGAFLAIRLRPQELSVAASMMFGTGGEFMVDFDLAEDRVLNLRFGGFSFETVLHRICALIDSYSGQSVGLEALGLDQLLYRNLALMLQPEGLLRRCVAEPAGGRTRRPVDAVCQYMENNLQRPITLATLERVSGLSARGLQVAFQKRFGCSPMRWLRDRRLDSVQRHLRDASGSETVASIARSYGFTRLGAFAKSYADRFGELPSATLGRRSG